MAFGKTNKVTAPSKGSLPTPKLANADKHVFSGTKPMGKGHPNTGNPNARLPSHAKGSKGC